MSDLCKAWTLSSAKTYTEFKSISNKTGRPINIHASVEKDENDSPVINFNTSVGGLVVENYMVKEYRKKVDELFDKGVVLELILGVKNYKNIEYVGLVETLNEDKIPVESIYYFSDDNSVKFKQGNAEFNSWPEGYRRFVNGRLSVYFSDFVDCIPECGESLEKKLISFRPEGYVPSVRKNVKLTYGEGDIPGDHTVPIDYTSSDLNVLSKSENKLVNWFKNWKKNTELGVIRSRR